MIARYGFRLFTTAALLFGAVLFSSAIARAGSSVLLPIADAIRRCV